MSLRFIDSFDHYSDTEIQLKWTQAIGAGATIVSNGRNGKGIKLLSGLVNNGAITKTLDYQNVWTVGFAMYNVSGANPPGGALYRLHNNDKILMELSQDADGTLSLQANASVYGLTVLSLNPNTWYYIEIQNTTGTTGANVSVTSVLRINGNTVLNPSAKDTGVPIASTISGTNKANRHLLGCVITNGTIIDDVYMCDGTGGVNDTFIGDIKIGVLFPDGDSTPLQWTPSAAGTHFSLIDENPPNNDTDYISDNTVNDIDNWTWQDIASFTGTIPGVQYLIFARKDDEGYRSIKHTV